VTDPVAVCSDLSARYCHAFDRRELERYLDLFTADGVFESRFADGSARIVRGRDELAAFLSSRGAGGEHAHVAYAPAVLEAGEDEIRAATVFARLAAGDPPIDAWGTYDDHVVRETDGRWRFRARIAEVAWTAPGFVPPT
jgi:hypothetical protein